MILSLGLHKKEGDYFVKITYMLGKGFNLETFHEAWVTLWKVEASPKVRLFIWRLCTSTLPTRALLAHRHLIEDVNYPWCGEEETTTHVLFLCIRVRELWEESGYAHLIEHVNISLQETLASWAKVEKKW